MPLFFQFGVTIVICVFCTYLYSILITLTQPHEAQKHDIKPQNAEAQLELPLELSATRQNNR